MVGFAGATICNAQSIVGKWKEVSSKGICNAKGVKITGKEFVISTATDETASVMEFRSNHTYTTLGTATTNTAGRRMAVTTNGTYILSGDQLTATLDANQPNPLNNPKKDAVAVTPSTIHLNGNSLVISHIMTGSPILEKMEISYKRL